MENLKDRVLSALRWTAVARFTAQLLTWGITLLVIRLLEPKDYGLMAMSEVVFAFLLMLSSAGLGSALIQAKELTPRQVRQMFAVLLLVNGALFVAQYLSAPALGVYYREPRVVLISRVLGLGFLIVPFSAIPSALLSREIDFKRKAIVELVASVVSVLCVLALAYQGMGVWALITGRLLNLALLAIGLNIVRPFFQWPVFSFRAIRGLIRFGGYYTLTTVLWYVYSQSDIFVAGRFLTPEILGLYAVGIHIASLAMVKLMPLLNQIALPAYSRVQQDPSAVSFYFLKSVRIVSVVSFPVFFGMATVSPLFTRLILGPRYEGAILPLILLSLIMPVRTVNNLFSPAVNGVGRPDIQTGNALIAAIVMPAAFLIGVQWSIRGICLAWLAAFPLVFAVTLVRSAPVIRVAKREVLRALRPAMVSSLLMSAPLVFWRTIPSARAESWLELGAMVLTGAAIYLGVLWGIYRGQFLEVLDTIRRPSS